MPDPTLTPASTAGEVLVVLAQASMGVGFAIWIIGISLAFLAIPLLVVGQFFRDPASLTTRWVFSLYLLAVVWPIVLITSAVDRARARRAPTANGVVS